MSKFKTLPPIFGIYHFSRRSPDPEIVSRMNRAAEYVIPRQLKSLEFEGGCFVVAAQDKNSNINKYILRSGDHVIAADVSLYKRETLLKKLNRDPHDFSISDAAVILESYIAWGSNCLNYLYGDYAFIIVNIKNGNIFCGRDTPGVRPFFYHLHDDCFIFASELRYVVESFDIKPGVDKDYLLNTLVNVSQARDKTPFKGILRLLPGYSFSCNKERTSLNAFWYPDTEKRTRLNKEDDYIQLFREHLTDAVNMRCNDAESLGSELSGGLDSSAVTGIAANYADLKKIRFNAFSNVLPEDAAPGFMDERKYIHQMLQYKKIEWDGINRLNGTIKELLRSAIEIQGCFIQHNFSTLNRGLYETSYSKKVNVMLSGFGGDELVSARIGMPWNEIIGGRHWKILADELFYKGVSIKALVKAGKISGRYLYSRLFRQKNKTLVFTSELLDRKFANLPLQPSFALKHDLKKQFTDKYSIMAYKSMARRQVERLQQNYIPQHLEYCYTAAAQYGLEYRYPLLDMNLIETCLAFPPWLKQHHGINRYVFREAIKGFVPESIRNRNDKTGATIPQAYCSLVHERNEILSMIKDASDSEFLKEIFDFSRFTWWYDKLAKRESDAMKYLMPGAFYQYLMMLLYYSNEL